MKRFVLCFLFLGFSVFLFSGCATVKDASDVGAYQQRASDGDEAAVKALIGALRDGDKQVRDAAYKALISAGKPAVPMLLETLKDKDPDMQEYAAGALGNIGDERAIAPLVSMLENGGGRRYIAAWALGEMKASGSVDLLIKALGEKNEALQKEATRSLIKIGSPAVPKVIEALKSPGPDVRKYAARALGIIQDKRAEEPLISVLGDGHLDVAAAAALSLGTAGTEKAIKPLTDALSSRDMTIKINASISLGQLEAKGSVDTLTSVMENDDDPYVRQWCARALENITGNRYKYKDEHGAMVFPYNLYR
jgi:HEAT repeat protein